MITEEMVMPVGRIFKPHSYKGEVRVEVFFDRDLYDNPKMPFFIKIDNIFVPFFVEFIGGGSKNSSFIKFKGINSDIEAAKISKREFFAEKKDIAAALGVSEEDLEIPEEELIGYSVIDGSTGKTIGEIKGFEEGVEYDYMIVKQPSDEVISIPFIEEFIEEISDDENEKIVMVSLPEGFLEI